MAGLFVACVRVWSLRAILIVGAMDNGGVPMRAANIAMMVFAFVLPASAETYEEFLRRDPEERAATYWGYFYGAAQSDRSSPVEKELLVKCAVNYSAHELQPDIERDMANLAKVMSGPVYDVGLLLAKAAYATCVRKIQR
jgi:hypothetical protein